MVVILCASIHFPAFMAAEYFFLLSLIEYNVNQSELQLVCSLPRVIEILDKLL